MLIVPDLIRPWVEETFPQRHPVDQISSLCWDYARRILDCHINDQRSSVTFIQAMVEDRVGDALPFVPDGLTVRELQFLHTVSRSHEEFRQWVNEMPDLCW